MNNLTFKDFLFARDSVIYIYFFCSLGYFCIFKWGAGAGGVLVFTFMVSEKVKTKKL